MRTRDKPARVHGSRGGIQQSTKGEGRSGRSSRHSNNVRKCKVHLPSILTRGWTAKQHGQRLFGAATQRADPLHSYHCNFLFSEGTPLYLRTTTPPVKIRKNTRVCHPKSKIVPTCDLYLSAPARVRGEVSRGNEGRGALKPILDGSARRNKKNPRVIEVSRFRY